MEAIRLAFQIIMRSIIAVIALQLLTRMNGAKQISQLSFYDYITGITIGSMAAYMAIDEQIPFWVPMISIAIFVIAAYLENQWTMRSLKARKLINGTPTLLMADGKLLWEHMKKAHLTVNDLLSEARVAGYFDLSLIAFALMENSGKISFLPYPEKHQNQSNTPTLYVNVIIDSEIMTQELAIIGKDENWLRQGLQKHSLALSDIALALADDKGSIRFYRKEKTAKPTHIFL